MEKRRLGNSDIQVHPLMFGGNVFGWTADEPTSFQLLDAFVDAGFDFIDTADVYSRWAPGHQGGESESLLGKWFQRSGKRSKVILATKVGKEMGPGKKGLSRQYITQAVEDSLKRLQTDYIDLYQSHDDDQGTPLEETLGAYGSMIQQGKVRVIGASNYTGERLLQALELSKTNGLPSYESLQPLYNLYDRGGYETDLEPVCREHGLGVIPYFSLAAGFLTGKYRSEADLANRPRSGMVKKYLNGRGMAILQALDEVAGQQGTQPGTVALAWLMARPGITAPIVSATSLEQFATLREAAELVLDEASMRTLDRASS